MDYNSLNNNAFSFSLKRLPYTTFRVVSVNIPSINVPPPDEGSMAAMQYFPGSATEFEPLQLTFIVDENLKNYEEMYRWITQQRYATDIIPGKHEQFLVSDGALVTMTNASNANRIFQFKDCFPIDLGSLQFDTRDSNPEPVICSVSFRYSYFSLLPKVV